MSFSEVGCMSGYFVSNHAVFYILLVRQSEMFLRGYVAEHGGTVPTDHGGTNGAGNVIVSGGDIGREWPESVKRSFLAPLQLFFHVLFNQMHGDVAGTFIHDLTSHFPGDFGQLTLGAE